MTGLTEPGEDWTFESAQLLAQFGWAPRTFGRRTVDEVVSQVWPLAHQLNIFFRIAPRRLAERWLRALLPRATSPRPHLTSARDHPVASACQPDLVFQADQSRLFVGLQTPAGGEAEQLWRFAAFAAWMDRQFGPQRTGVVLMGPERRLRGLEALLGPGAAPQMGEPMRRLALDLGLPPEAVTAVLRSLDVAVTTYGEFDEILAGECGPLGGSEGDETLATLIDGLRRFMRPWVTGASPSSKLFDGQPGLVYDEG